MDFASIHNYYEHLVIDYMTSTVIPRMPDKDADFFLDVSCYALTMLPARYMRHEIDMAFYLSSDERIEMVKKVSQAVEKAIKHIESHDDKKYRKEASHCS